MKIIINNRDTKFTIDRYYTFTENIAIDNMVDQYNVAMETELTRDDFEWEHDSQAVYVELAKKSIECIQGLDKKGIIQDIALIETQEDSYVMECTVDTKKLSMFEKENAEAVTESARIYGLEVDDKVILTYYLDTIYDYDTYFNCMNDVNETAWRENTTMKPKK